MSASRHVVHVERMPAGGVQLWLDGHPLKGVQSWGLIEEIQEPSRLSVTILVGSIVWGAPPRGIPEAPRAFADDGKRHWFDRTSPTLTPSGKNACAECGEPWPCSTAMARWKDHGDYSYRVDNSSGAPLD